MEKFSPEGDLVGLAARENQLHEEEEDGLVHFYLPYGEWIRLFRGNGLVVEALREIQPPDGAESTYRGAAETEWARHWPMEQIWSVRKE